MEPRYTLEIQVPEANAENVNLQAQYYIHVLICAALLGIQDLSKPDYGESVELQPGDVPVFWACGVTAIEAILSSSEQFEDLVP